MPESMTSNPKVVIVDDEKKFLHLAKKNLNLRGFEVEVAEAGEEGMPKSTILTRKWFFWMS